MIDVLLQDPAVWLIPLLPITALAALIQVRPYPAVMARGMFGATAGLAYLVLGAPDVALTEILMGTLLVTFLYVITIRSSMAVTFAHDGDGAPEATVAALAAPFKALHLRVTWTRIVKREKVETALRRGDLDVAIFGDTILVAPHARTARRVFLESPPEGWQIKVLDS